MNSRLARQEQRKILRQTILFGGLAVILFLAFLFIILPQSVRLVSNLAGNTGGNPFDITDTIPPQTPVLDAPPLATPSAQLAISGLGEPETEIVLVVNAAEQSRTTAADDGRFSFNVALQEGENTINLYAMDTAGNESPSSQTYYIIRDSQPPKLTIEEPQDGQTVELRRNQVITIKGETDPNARVMVNGRLAFARNDGTFSTTYQLNEGENTLVIEAEDEAGNKSTVELKVTFRL